MSLAQRRRASPHSARSASPRHRLVPNWLTNCDVFPELPFVQGWVEAMTSLGRLIFFDQPGTGASDPVTPGALPTLEQWADSITAVLDDLGSREAVLLAIVGALAPAPLFAATYPSRTSALVVLEGSADPLAERTGEPTSEVGSITVLMAASTPPRLANLPRNRLTPAERARATAQARFAQMEIG